MMEQGKMERVLRYVYSSKGLSILLSVLSHTVSALAAICFVIFGVLLFSVSPLSLVRFLVIIGIPFVAVTLMRRLIDAPRPYEVYDFYEIPPKSKQKSSYPSRHAFSAFSIGTLICFLSPIVGALLLLFSTLMCISRVLLGIHFIRDVVAGALIGIISSVLGFIILSPL